MRRGAFVAALAAGAAVAGRPAGATSLDYDLRTSTGTLAGTLDLPAGSRPPVVLVLPEAGPTDRNGNATGERDDAYALLAAALVARGVACVRFDKRGVGASSAALRDPKTTTIETFVADAVAWLAKLRADGRFTRVVVAGHGEGALIGMLAIPRGRAAPLASLAGPGRTLGRTVRAQAGDRLLTEPELLRAANHIVDELEAGRTVADVPDDLMPLFAPEIQHYLISAINIDPVVAIRRVHAPIAIVQGTYDLQVPLSDAKLLAAAVPAARLVVVERMSHELKIASDNDMDDQVRTVYTNPALPLAPAVADAVAALARG